jgi:hypothetical protein
MADVEKLHFKIGLAGTYWDKKPRYGIMVNDQIIKIDNISAPSGEVEYIEFDANIEEGPCKLKIKLINKEDSDVVKDDSSSAEFKIVKDLLLNIKSVEIDEIDLANLIYSKSTFIADDPNRPDLDMCIDLGWNGTWVLSFDSPFYIWLLENI